MRLHPIRAVSSLLVATFISTSITPAFALRPAGLEEQSDASKDEVVAALDRSMDRDREWTRMGSADEVYAHIQRLAGEGNKEGITVQMGDGYLSPADPRLLRDLKVWGGSPGVSFYLRATPVRGTPRNVEVTAMTPAEFSRRLVGEMPRIFVAQAVEHLGELGNGWTVQLGLGDSAKQVPASDTQALRAALADYPTGRFYSGYLYADRRVVLMTGAAGLEEFKLVDDATVFAVGGILKNRGGTEFSVTQVMDKDNVAAKKGRSPAQSFTRSQLQQGWEYQPPAAGLEEGVLMRADDAVGAIVYDPSVLEVQTSDGELIRSNDPAEQGRWITHGTLNRAVRNAARKGYVQVVRDGPRVALSAPSNWSLPRKLEPVAAMLGVVSDPAVQTLSYTQGGETVTLSREAGDFNQSSRLFQVAREMAEGDGKVELTINGPAATLAPVTYPSYDGPTSQELESDLREEDLLQQVRAKYSPASYGIGLRVGGNNVSAGLVNAQAETDTRLIPETKWRWMPEVMELLGLDSTTPYTADDTNAAVLDLVPVPERGKLLTPEQQDRADKIADLITREAIAQVVELVRAPGLPVQGLRVIHVAIPSPVDSVEGVVGTPYPASNVPGFDHYPLARKIQEGVYAELGVEVPVVVENDSPSRYKGEKLAGSGVGFNRIAIFIWGTGMNGSDHAGRWFELGHALVGKLGDDGKWHYRNAGAETARPALELGELEVEQRLGGGAGLPEHWLQPNGFTIPEEVTKKAAQGDTKARKLIQESGQEFGRALAVVFADDYEQSGRSPEGILERFILVSGISENLGLGVKDEQGRDILVGAVQDGAREELTQRLNIPADAAEQMVAAIVRTQGDAALEIAGTAEEFQPGRTLERLNTTEKFWAYEDLTTIQARPILVNASEDVRLGRLAQALSVMISRDRTPEAEFRLVIAQDQVMPLLQQLRAVNPAAADDFLAPRVVAFDSVERTAEQARVQAATQLARATNTDAVMEVKDFTPDLALDLQAFFKEGGLLFVTGEAFNRLRAFLEAA